MLNPRPLLVIPVSVLLGALVSILSPAPASCAEPLPPGPLSLDAAVRRALSRHPALSAAALGTEAARHRADQARTAWLPRVRVGADYRYQGPVPELTIDTGMTMPGASEPLRIARELGSEHNASLDVEVGWRALDFGSRAARIAAAERGVEAARLERAEAAVELAFAVRASYLTVLLHDGLVDVTERSLETARRERSEEEIRRSAGLSDDVAVASAETRVADLESRLATARHDRARAQEELAILLGDAGDGVLELSDGLVDPSPTGGGDESAIGGHPALARLGAHGAALELERRAVDRAFWPTVDLFGRVAYQYPQDMATADEPGFVWAAGVALEWEVFDGDLRRRRGRELDASVAAMRERRRAAHESVERSLAAARAGARTAASAVAAAHHHLASAEVYLKAARASLAAGTGTALDVRKAEEAVDGARLALLRGRYAGAMAEAQRLQALGLTGVGEAGLGQ